MGQQEDFRTPVGGADAAPDGPAPPLFDERSARRVVPLERVARRERFARLFGGWRETVGSPQFRRSWPLALLLVATLAAAVAATTNYTRSDDAPNAARTTATATAEATAEAPATADAETAAAASPARAEAGDSLEARGARRGRESNVSTDAAAAVNSQAFAASALGGFLGDDDEARDGQGDPAASGRDERGGERERGKRQKRSKRRHGERRSSGGAILFDVIR